MKVHMVVSLNVTGSFADDIIRVVSSVRYRPLWLITLAKNVLEIIRHLIKVAPSLIQEH